jgi:hypothetical protein
MKVRYVVVSLAVALMVAVGSVRAADEWFVLSEQTLKTANPSVEVKSSGGRWEKDIKKVKFSVEGADVEITKAVLHWNNRPNDTIADLGVVKAGGETAPKSAPGLKGRLTGVTVQYKILGDAPTATFKVWGYD